MSPLPKCFARGMLVSKDHWIPADPFEHAPDGSILPAVGCNQLRCAECGADVRVLHGVSASPSADPATLYAADPSTLPTERVANLYVCRCRAHTERSTQHLDDFETMRPLSLPWACAGHPLPPSPLTLDGDLIDLDPLEPTVRALLCATLPRHLHPAIASLAGFQAVRAFRLLDPTQRAALDACVAARLPDPDPLTRRGALGFFRILPSNPGAQALLDLQRRRSLWSAPDPIDPSATLQHTLRLALDAIERASS